MANTISSLHSTIKSVPLAKMRVSTAAQRVLKPARVLELTSIFDLEQLGYLVVNFRDGWWWIVDGQHRFEALKRWLGYGWEKQSLDCRAYDGKSEQDEAKMFLRLNNALAVSAFDKFKRAVFAGYSDERSVEKAADKAGLKIAREKGDGHVSAVTTLMKIYKRSDAKTLTRSLALVYQSFGDPGLSNNIIDGIARVCERYNGALDDTEAIERLQSLRGGVGALTTRAMLLRKQTGVSIPECIAAATIDALNTKRGGKKLPSWWKE